MQPLTILSDWSSDFVNFYFVRSNCYKEITLTLLTHCTLDTNGLNWRYIVESGGKKGGIMEPGGKVTVPAAVYFLGGEVE